MKKQRYLCIGIMTGNSLDAVDAVLTAFDGEKVMDICGYSKDIPTDIAEKFRKLKENLSANGGDIALLCNDDFMKLHDKYINLVAQTVTEMMQINKINSSDIDAVGFHGQTCYHLPPSLAGANQQAKTIQIGSGQMLSDLLNMPVVYDFRSDDIINGGEGAPLAPIHNMHLAIDMQKKGMYPAVFCNGGNTGNVAVVFDNHVVGWDCGPFNHFVDEIVRLYVGENCDFDGKYGQCGKVDFALLKQMFEQSVITHNEENFLLKVPPKSSDPAWYKMPKTNIAWVNSLRTAEFFSAYIMAYSLKFLPIKTPDYFLLFGGGWNNPLIRHDFENLIHGKAIVLPEHQEIFAQLSNQKAVIEWSDEFGYNGKFMEARIFADMAKCFLTKEAFSFPETTGCKVPTVGGIMTTPNSKDKRLWSRAAFGVQKT